MQKSKLIQYLSQLSAQDLHRFRDFVASPFFNKHEKTKALLDFLLKNKNWESPYLNKENVFQKIFPRKEYEEQLLSNIISYLLQLVRRFLAQQQFEKKNTQQQLGLLEITLHLGQKKLFELTARRLKKQFGQAKIQDSQFFIEQSRYQRLLDDFDLSFGDRNSGEHLEKAIQNFDVFFIGEKLKMTCQMLARRQVTGREYMLFFVKELTLFLEKEAAMFREIPSVWIYFLIYKMLTEDKVKFYFQLKSRLKQDAPFFHHQEGRDLYTHALNYCIQRINFGEAPFRKETFELYQQMLDNGLLFIDGVLPQWDYTNIVSLGCHLGEFDWTKDFIFQQKEQLPKGEKENTFTYNLAAFFYSQQEFAAALDLLREVAFTDVYYDLLTRLLLLKIYFERENWQALEYALETFRIYLLRNKKITDNRRKSSLNLIRFTKKLMRLMEGRSVLSKQIFKQQVSLLKTQIEEKQMVLNKSWLLQQLAMKQ